MSPVVLVLGRRGRGVSSVERDARQLYLAAYDELRALGPQPDVVHDLSTEFGTVRVYQHAELSSATMIGSMSWLASAATAEMPIAPAPMTMATSPG